MSKQALLIDYEFCSNCHTCEVECKMEHGFPEGAANGIKVFEVGPWQIEGDRWQLTYLPTPTDMCDLCAERTAKGKAPSCVQHCQAQCLSWGDVEELARAIDSPKQMVVAVREA